MRSIYLGFYSCRFDVVKNFKRIGIDQSVGQEKGTMSASTNFCFDKHTKDVKQISSSFTNSRLRIRQWQPKMHKTRVAYGIHHGTTWPCCFGTNPSCNHGSRQEPRVFLPWRSTRLLAPPRILSEPSFLYTSATLHLTIYSAVWPHQSI